MNQKHYSDPPVGMTGTIDWITKARWHQNEVNAVWESGGTGTLDCLSWTKSSLKRRRKSSPILTDKNSQNKDPNGLIRWGFLIALVILKGELG